MKLKIIAKGAEAQIILKKNQVTKKRISKSYRHPELDKRLIKQRTKAETKILKKASKIIPTPNPSDQIKQNEIIMPMIDGDKLSEKLDSYTKQKQEKILTEIGKSIATLHKNNIIHGDLTTSNMILKNNKTHIIDFGLGSLNGKYEQKGVDIHLLRQALEAKHFKNSENLFKKFITGYKSINKKEAQKVLEKVKSIEKRGRYKH